MLLAFLMVLINNCDAADKEVVPLVKLEPLSQKVVINIEQMDLNKFLNVIRDNTDCKLILAPEFSGAESLKKIIALPKGVITLRELLDTICIQLEAKWVATGTSNEILINPMQNTIVAEDESAGSAEAVYSVDYAGKSLRRVLQDLHRRSGANIVMTGNVGNIRIEVMMADAPIEKILEHIADIYNLRLTLSADGVYKIGR